MPVNVIDSSNLNAPLNAHGAGAAGQAKEESLLKEFSSLIDKISMQINESEDFSKDWKNIISEQKPVVKEEKSKEAEPREVLVKSDADKKSDKKLDLPTETSPEETKDTVKVEQGGQKQEEKKGEKVSGEDTGEVAQEGEILSSEILAVDQGKVDEKPAEGQPVLVVDQKALELLEDSDASPTLVNPQTAEQLKVLNQAAKSQEGQKSQQVVTTQNQLPNQMQQQAQVSQVVATQVDQANTPQAQQVVKQILAEVADTVAANQGVQIAQPVVSPQLSQETQALLKNIEQIVNNRLMAVSQQPIDKSLLVKESAASIINSSTMLKGFIDSLATKGNVNTNNIAATIQNITGAEMAAVNKGDVRATKNRSTENQSSPTKELVQKHELRTLEKVEEALKEVAKSKDGKTLSFRLDPPQLGQVKIDVSFRDGVLHARLGADNALVNNLLREKSAQLQQVLRDLGIEVERISVAVSDDGGFNSRRDSHQNRSEFMADGSFEGKEESIFGKKSSGGKGVNSSGNQIGLSNQKAVVDDHWVA